MTNPPMGFLTGGPHQSTASDSERARRCSVLDERWEGAHGRGRREAREHQRDKVKLTTSSVRRRGLRCAGCPGDGRSP
uniref:Uncharacterized protein n=1 Tax=Arundo donax TaxID=35708 RepID=A0A0A9ADS9_ARUDO